jgi:GDP-mannose 6-dehydrogenase
MKISVLGLGYVGCTEAACLAKMGNEIRGVDINPEKVKLLNSGKSPITEKDLIELIEEQVANGRIKAFGNVREAMLETNISLVCVGTPSHENGKPDLDHVTNVLREVGTVIRQKDEFHIVVIRSTVYPGSTEKVFIPVIEETSGKKCDVGFGIAINPEFMREGTSVEDYFNPPLTVVGSENDKVTEVLRELYSNITTQINVCSYKEAEMVKYACNIFHALKITFANEIGIVSKTLGIDAHKVMEYFCSDKKLNISDKYLKPGYAYGGSCLPKDTRAFVYEAKHSDIETPLIAALEKSNDYQIKRVFDLIKSLRKRRIGFLGISFKEGTDDLRESPQIRLIKMLIGEGMEVNIYDENVSMAKLLGRNRDYIEREIPRIANYIKKNIEHVLSSAEVIIIGNKDKKFEDIINGIKGEKEIVDLVRIKEDVTHIQNYHGICW